jgi:hypothetical protein
MTAKKTKKQKSATLTFYLPDDEYDFKLALKAHKHHSALSALANKFRANTKYLENQETNWNEVRDLFWTILKEKEVELDL